jgi:2-polyprenyl-3-methyl-5-hydroxy-6-metoxy-1,4-benzoquinol methylase
MIQSFYCAICRFRREDFTVLCPVTLGRQTRFDLIECSVCKTRQLYPLPSIEQLEMFYSAGYYGGDWYKQRGLGKAFAGKYLAHKKNGNYLEVGCSLGYFLDGVRTACGWTVSGVEFGSEAVRHARNKLDLDVRQGELSEIGYPSEEFDFIRICNVLEHVTDPLAMLEECRRIIKPEGFLHLSIPNGVTDSRYLLNFFVSEKRPPLSKDGHLFFFPKNTLLQILEMTGFRAVEAGTISIRRGLRSLGFYPPKKSWKKPYFSTEKDKPSAGEIRLSPEKKRPDIYYRWRQKMFDLKMLRGLNEYGLEFKLLLKPA